MTRPRFDIAAAVNDSVSKRTTVSAEDIARQPAPGAEPPPKAPKVSSRTNARGVTVFLPEESWMELKMLAVRNKRTVQDLVSSTLVEMIERSRGEA